MPSVSLLAGMVANLDTHYNEEIMEIPVFFVENSWIFVLILMF